MAIITQLQWLLLRLGLSHAAGQNIFIAAFVCLLVVGGFRLDGLDVSAKSTLIAGGRSEGSSQSALWQTVYEFEPDALRPASMSFALDGSAISPKTVAEPQIARSGESLFLQSYRLQQQGDYAQALKVAEDMVHRYPNFQLGNLLWADLIASIAATPNALDSLWQKPEAQRRLSELRTEALKRTLHPGKDYFVGKQPDVVRYLTSDINRVVVVDAQRSRLYVLARNPEASSASPLQVIFDAYVSLGNNGIGKWREGDSKTPVGVYFVQKHLTDPMLPDLYGSGALTLDYPSPIDRWQQRTGSGIWLHGSPSNQYARPPTATDGCVVLANDDMIQLVRLGIQSGTPVIIADQLAWLPSAVAQSGDQTQTSYTVLGRNIPMPWFEPADTHDAAMPWRMVSAFQWTDKQQTVAVVSFDPPTASGSKQRRHTYWIMQGDQWQQVNSLGKSQH